MLNRKGFRASVCHLLADPNRTEEINQSYEYIDDALLVVEDGHILALGDYQVLISQYPDLDVQDFSGKLISSGFIDTHIHYPQMGMIGSYGEQLLDWLNQYTFPEELKFADKDYAQKMAQKFVKELLAQGTTTALVFATVHPESVDAFFEQAQAKNLRMIAGKVMMDRHAPDELCDTPESSYQESKALIEKWHGNDRLLYAVTPRFAPTSSSAQLAKAGQLLDEYPDVYLHTHLSENKQEIEWVKDLFPEYSGYLDVYAKHGLVRERSVFAHGVHLTDDECQCLGQSGSAVAFCPTSNLFLGSGLLDLERLEAQAVKVGLGTDVGAGTSFSMLQTMGEAYKVLQLQDQKFHPLKALYQATLGGAKALYLDDKIGNLAVGKEADFIVLDFEATALMRQRNRFAKDIIEQLFLLMIMGDDRSIAATFIQGECAYIKR